MLALLLCLASILATPLHAQGSASRGVKPTPRGKPSGRPFHARFVDVAREAGLTEPVVYGGVSEKDYIVETVGSGAAFVDYDDDGWIDIFLLSGIRRDDSAPAATNRLYHNNRDGTFRDVTKRAGLQRAGWASSVAVGDYDNDGFSDLFITYWGRNVLYRNRGDGSFEDITNKAGVGGEAVRWGAGAAFLDYDRDGLLDLFVSHYLKFDFETAPGKGTGANCTWKGVPVNCGPRGLPPETPRLYHNEGDGTFHDVTAKSGVGEAFPGYGMTAVAADFSADGWIDIYLASDSTPSLLFHNNQDGTFTEEGLERGVALSEDGVEQAGMGVATGDYDGDGDLDILKTHFMEDTNVLYRNDGQGNFEDATAESGLGVETRFVGWGAAMADLDNDSLPDLFYVTGNVYPEVEAALPEFPYRTPRVIFRNLGEGQFEELIEEAGPGISDAHASRGSALGDFDNDGDLDILIVNLNEPPSLLRNDYTGEGNWIKVKLIGTESNRGAIGAVVTADFGDRRVAQPVLSQTSFYSADERRLHFGLGEADTVDIEVRWPSGKIETHEGLAAGRLVTIVEAEGSPKVTRLPSK